jgi:hypothetical protein
MPSWLLVVLLVIAFVIALGVREGAKTWVLLASGIAATVVLGILLLEFTDLPDWVAIALTAVGLLIVLVGRGSDEALIPVVGVGIFGFLLVLVIPLIFQAIFGQPWISEDDYRAVGSKQLDTLEEVDDRFGEPVDDLGKDLGTAGGKGETCRYYWTKKYDLPGAHDNAYELCFKRATGKFTSKRNIDLELVPG